MRSDSDFKTVSFGRLTTIFVGIMLLFLALTAEQTQQKLNSEFDRKVINQLEASLDQVILQTSDESFAYNRFKELIETARQHGINSLRLQQEVVSCVEKYKLPVKCFFYQNQQLVRSFYAEAEELLLFAPILQGMAAKNESFIQAQRQLHQMLLDYFGPGNRLELVKLSKSMVRRYRVKNSDQFYYWNDMKDGLGVFFIATRPNTFIERFKSIYTEPCEFGAGNPTTQEWVPPRGISPDQTAAAFMKARLSGQNHTLAFGHIWYFVTDETGVVWCRADKLASSEEQRPEWAQKVFLVSAALCLAALLIYLCSLLGAMPGTTFCKCLDSLSIKYRVLGLFSMASVFPVIFTVLIGSASLADRVEVIENSIISESIAAIEPLEKMFKFKLAQSERMCKDLRLALLTEPGSEELFMRYLNKYSIPRDLSRFEVRDGNGNTLFSTDDREVHGVVGAMDIFSKIALKLHAPARMGSAIDRVSPAEIVSESVLSTDELGMATVMRQRGRQWVFRMGTFPTTWFWDVYPEIATGPAFTAVTTQVQIVYSNQVRSELNKKADLNDSISMATEMNYDYCDFEIQPERSDVDKQKLLSSALASLRSGRVVNRVTQINERPFWLTVKPEKNIKTHVFFHLISQSERLNSLNPLKWQLAGSGLMALIVSLLGAILITRLVILPVQDLGAGISAIRNRNHDFRTPVRRDDEFGALATAFNKVIGELKELEYGKIVQESLLPREPIIPDGYDIAFFNTSATDLAGDYHDTIQLDDGRLAIILGDVTGHGISAALAMAMAKATVNHTGNDGTKYPQTLMNSLNALFSKELKPRHKFMTLVTIVIDPTSGKLEVDNAGQSYPRLFSAEKRCSADVAIPSMPLGAMKKRKAKIEVRQMQSNDAFILYTDGIIECSDTTGDMFGYDRFNDLFDSLMNQRFSASGALKEMMRQLDDFRVAGAYPDDVTMVIVRKL
ncbi:MAG: SpoIIE family protein phosphatase [Candidatus Riflebacteria bacterium]|nr:SpoIIE family protein phosphatase [Candidatus Riflebacteria bacterium]